MQTETPPKRGERLLTILLMGLIAVSGGFGAFILAHNTSSPQSPLGGIDVNLHVTVRNQTGQIIPQDTRNVNGDLVLNNFNNFLAGLFNPTGASVTGGGNLAPGAGSGSGSGTNCDSGSNPSASFFWGASNCIDSSESIGYDSNTETCTTTSPCGGMVEIGTSSTAPTRADTGVTTLYGSETLTSSSTCSTGTTDSVDFSGTVSITSTATITEAAGGINTAYGYASGGATTGVGFQYFNFFHDTFTGISVASGDSVDVSYSVSLGTAGFNVNLCNFLAGLFSPVTNQNGVAVSLKDTAGTATDFYIWTNQGSSANCILSTSASGCSSPSAASFIAIGTGTTAYTPTTYALGTQVASTTMGTISYVSGTTSTIYYPGTFTTASGDPITEGAIGLTLSSNNYLFFGSTFTAQSAGNPFGISAEISD